MISILSVPTTDRAAVARTSLSVVVRAEHRHKHFLRHDSQSPPLDTGFTLIELLVCLVILAGLTAIALPQLAAKRTPSLEDWAEDIALDLARLRQDAMGSGTVRIAPSEALAAILTPGIQLQSAEPPNIMFMPNGMANGALWQLESGGRSVQLAVDWLTGRITIDAP